MPSTEIRASSARSVLGQPLQAGGDQGVDRRRDGELARRLHERPVTVVLLEQPVVDQHREQLLHEERIALGGVGDTPGLLARKAAATEQVRHELPALVRGERLQQDRGGVALAAAPAGALLEQLRPRHAEQHDRRVAREVGHVLDKVQERGLGPLKVVEHHHERALPRQRLEQPTSRPEDLLARAEPGSAEPDRLGQDSDDLLGLRLLAELLPDRLSERRALPVLVHVDEVPHDLAERPVGDALAVGEAAPAEHARALTEALDELVDETRLSDARATQHGHEVTGPVRLRRGQDAGQGLELLGAAHQRRVEPPRSRAFVTQLHDTAAELSGLGCHDVAHQPPRGVVDQDLVRPCKLLQALGGVHCISARERPAASRMLGKHLPGPDPDARAQPDPKRRLEFVTEPGEDLPHLERGAHRSGGVVVVQERNAEHGHEQVAGIGLHRPAVALEHVAHAVEALRARPAYAPRGRGPPPRSWNRSRRRIAR